MRSFKITKKSGQQVLFDEKKMRMSLLGSGADDEVVEKVLEELYVYAHDGMSTHKVYKKAYSILVKLSHRTAGRYRLKNSMLELGPTGYPFERFIGELLKSQGFDTSVGQFIEGRCVKHEVDVVAENDEKIIVVECKFHQDGKGKSDVKVPMYIRSRFDDINNQWLEEGRIRNRKFEGWLVTNTRFTEDAEVFGTCSGLKLLSWNYPEGNSLKDMIDKSGLHPLTSLKNLTKKEKQSLLDNGIVLCKQLTEDVLLNSDIDSRKIKKILLEAKSIFDS